VLFFLTIGHISGADETKKIIPITRFKKKLPEVLIGVEKTCKFMLINDDCRAL
jgi:hypothetical protein